MGLPIVGGIFWYLFSAAFVRAPGAALQNKFAKLGVLAGKSYDEIVVACGAPNAQSSTADGGRLCQWLQTGYHICLIFDSNNICKGINSEVSV